VRVYNENSYKLRCEVEMLGCCDDDLFVGWQRPLCIRWVCPTQRCAAGTDGNE